jgi:hypothetical protein
MENKNGRQQQKNQPGKLNDGLDIEFSQELADAEDLEAQERSQQADERAKNKPL